MAFDGKRSKDPSTYSEPLGPGRARATHYELDWTVDFVGKRLVGHVDVHCARNDAPTDGTNWQLVLDTAINLVVQEISVNGAALDRSMWNRDESKKSDALGVPLRIRLPEGVAGSQDVVRIAYETAAPDESGEGGSTALQWLTPAQTAGKKFPYVFSQCQAIHARAMLPCQDTCECKCTYAASIRCPAELNAIMSAVKISGPARADEPDWETPEGCGKEWNRHNFEQKVPVPAYLIAIACAALESKRVGPRSHVWSEKEMVDDCAWEFEETEKYLAAAENLCGPYGWGVYDLLILPPSFPYGGMENPCLTFVTPTLLAKDRSQVSVIAHEIAHSWSGNLVTNETWEHFWLNEGLTVFTEIRIVRDVLGHEEAALHLTNELKGLREDIDEFGKDHNFTRLVPDLSDGSDPDDAFSTVPYIKGMCLFSLLESIVGEGRFQLFIKDYFKQFAGKTVTSIQMRDFFLGYFKELAESDTNVSDTFAKVNWEHLWYAPGMPDFVPACDETPLKEAKQLAEHWAAAQSDEQKLAQFSAKDIDGWGTTKLITFLDYLLEDAEGSLQVTSAGCERMEMCYALLTKNSELRSRFLRIALRAKWAGAKDSAVDLMATQGRMKYTRPVYKALKSFDPVLAKETFLKHKNSYHPICTKMLAKDLEV